MNNSVTRIIQTVVSQSPAPQSFFELGAVMTNEMEEGLHFEISFQKFCLLHVSGNAVQNKMINLRLEFSKGHKMFHVLPPQIHGDLIWNKLPRTGVLQKGLSDLRP